MNQTTKHAANWVQNENALKIRGTFLEKKYSMACAWSLSGATEVRCGGLTYGTKRALLH